MKYDDVFTETKVSVRYKKTESACRQDNAVKQFVETKRKARFWLGMIVIKVRLLYMQFVNAVRLTCNVYIVHMLNAILIKIERKSSVNKYSNYELC